MYHIALFTSTQGESDESRWAQKDSCMVNDVVVAHEWKANFRMSKDDSYVPIKHNKT